MTHWGMAQIHTDRCSPRSLLFCIATVANVTGRFQRTSGLSMARPSSSSSEIRSSTSAGDQGKNPNLRSPASFETWRGHPLRKLCGEGGGGRGTGDCTVGIRVEVSCTSLCRLKDFSACAGFWVQAGYGHIHDEKEFL